jgi:hypothetical protein
VEKSNSYRRVDAVGTEVCFESRDFIDEARKFGKMRVEQGYGMNFTELPERRELLGEKVSSKP